jgi:hypothetical protein
MALINSVNSYIIPLMWVFSYKLDEDGYLDKYKARLVARGDLCLLTDQDTYAATLATRVFRALMAIAAYFDLDIYQFDAINAFTNTYLDEDVFVRFPDGFSVQGKCLKLIKALYRLPRSPLLWFNDLSATFKKLGLTQVPECACIFTSDKLVVFFFVDDIVILCHPLNRAAYKEF